MRIKIALISITALCMFLLKLICLNIDSELLISLLYIEHFTAIFSIDNSFQNHEMSNGWPLGLQIMNMRLRLQERLHAAAPVVEPYSLHIPSSSFSSFSSSNLDTEVIPRNLFFLLFHHLLSTFMSRSISRFHTMSRHNPYGFFCH